MYKQAAFILSENCNLNCYFCFQGQHSQKEKNMSNETFIKALDKCLAEDVPYIALFGGEPLVNFTEEMQQKLLKHKDEIHLLLFTNGLNLTDELIDYFLQFPKVKINISCHVQRSVDALWRTARKAKPHQYKATLVVNNDNFFQKFNEVKPVLDEFNTNLTILTEMPIFDYTHPSLGDIYDALVPYKTNLEEYHLYTDSGENVICGTDTSTEFIITYDGRISLTTGVNLSEETVTYPLEMPFQDIIDAGTNPNNDKIQHFPWQCRDCPIQNYPKANCPKAWGKVNDFLLCRRQILLYSIIKEEKELLCDEIMAEDPLSQDYANYSNKIQNIMLNVTDQCNFRCRMCFCDFADRYMTKEIADKGIELALSRKSPLIDKITINFFGGEPLLNFELIKYVVEKWHDQCDFSMTTNGSLLTDEILEFLSENKVGLLLSIDGDKETQDYNRPIIEGESSFDILYPKLPKILEKYPYLTFRSTLIPATVKHLYHNYCFAKEMGFKNYFCTPDAYSHWDESASNELQSQVVRITLDIIQDIYEGKVPLLPKFLLDGVADFIRIQDGLTSPSTSPLRCGLGIYGFGVGASGVVAACQEHSTITDKEDIFYIGDVWSGINEEKHWDLIDTYSQHKTRWIMNECLDCPLREACVNHVCPSRQGFMFKRFDKHAAADCLWMRVSYQAAAVMFEFFQTNFSPNFESFLKEVLANEGMELQKEVLYEV